jgi:hypothetical protein
VSQIGRFTVMDVSGVVVGFATRCGLVGGNNGSEECGASILWVQYENGNRTAAHLPDYTVSFPRNKKFQ